MTRKKSSANFGETRYKEWLLLLEKAIESCGDSQVEFCRRVHRISEEQYREVFKMPSGKTDADPWLSTSTLSRWLNATRCNIDPVMLSLIAKTGLIKDSNGNPLSYDKQARMVYLPKALDETMLSLQAMPWE